MGHFEYWRFFQSTQFLYLGSVREVTETEWAPRIRQTQRVVSQNDISNVPGFLSITNFIYSVTEIFEFAARLAQAGVYLDTVEISIRLSGIRGFVLAPDPDRIWRDEVYAATEPVLSYQQTFTPADLVTSAAEAAVNSTVWFFERFGWLKPNLTVIRSDQEKLLSGRF